MKHLCRSWATTAESRHAAFALRPLAAAMAAAFFMVSGSAWAQLPTGPAVVNGMAGIMTDGSRMTITNSPNAIVNWQAFSIGTQNSVRFEQQNAASQVLNRVVGNDPSSILGGLSSNGGVWLVNPHGVLFGSNARIDVGGLVASTLGISNDDFLAGRFRFEGLGQSGGQVLNQGEITTTFGGRVWLMGDSVRNEGVVQSAGGSIILAAGKSIELVDSGMPNVIVRVTAPENEALNLGSLLASAGGNIDLHGGIVNQQGIVRADSIGTDAAGRVVITAQGDVKLVNASVTSASATGTGAGGKLLVESTAGTTSVNGFAAATSVEGKGGQVHLLGENVGLFQQAVVDASGGIGGGEVLVGGDYQGKNVAVRNATAAYLAPETSIKANATRTGDGGKVILWGNNIARAYGTIEARGGLAKGNGGLIETSGGYLDAQPTSIDVGAPHGKAGTWLLDPHDVTIGETGNTESYSVNNNVFTSTSDSSTLAAATVKTSLDRGTNVTIETGDGGEQDGNIVVASSISTAAASPGSLTLNANSDIVLKGGVTIESAGGPMPVTLTAKAGGVYMVYSATGAAIKTNGGDIVMSGRAISAATAADNTTTAAGAANVVGSGIVINGGRLEAGAGKIKLSAVDAGTGRGVFITNPNITGANSVRSSLTARDIEIDGTGITASGVGIGFTDINASNSLRIKGDLTRPSEIFGVDVFGSSSLSSTNISITSNNAVRFLNGSSARSESGPLSISTSYVELSGGSSLQGGAVSITGSEVELEGGSSIRGAGASITASDLVATDRRLAATTPVAGGTLSISSGDLSIENMVLGADGRLSLSANGKTTLNNAQLASNAAGDAITIVTNSFRNTGSNMSVFEDGRWLIYLGLGQIPTFLSDLGGLAYDFVQVNTPSGSSPNPAGNGQDGVLLADPLNILVRVNASRSYDGTARAAFNSRISDNAPAGFSVLTLPEGAGALIEGTFNNKNVGVDKPVIVPPDPFGDVVQTSDSKPVLGGTLSYAADITPKIITASGFTADNKVYDATRTATLRGSLSEVISGDNASLNGAIGLFDTKNVGNGKTVTIEGGVLAGLDASNYALASAPATTTADITPRPITPSPFAAADKVYDGNRLATLSGGSVSGVIPGDAITFNDATGLFDTKNAGTGKTVSITGGSLAGADAGNYTLVGTAATATADITPRPISAAGINASDKVYDATRVATLSGSLSEAIAGDAVTLNGATGLFDTKNVGADKSVTIAGGVLAGVDSGNYLLTGPLTTSADITPRPLSIGITGSVTKEYDATTTASLAADQYALTGSVPGDALSVSGPVQGSYDFSNVGTGKSVTTTGSFQVAGADAPNYRIGAFNLTRTTSNAVSTTASGNVGTVTPATLTYVADLAVRERGLPIAGLSGNVTGFRGADSLITSTSGTLGWQAVATVESLPGSYAVDGTGLTAGNYVFTQAPGNATALALIPINIVDAPQQQAVESSTSAIDSALRSMVAVTLPRGSGGGVFDISNPAANRSFGPISVASMSQEELARLLEERRNFKRKLFADAIYKLEIDPSLADVQPCPSIAYAATGLCRITTAQLDQVRAGKVPAVQKSAKARTASLPQIERKIAVLFGINDYEDKKIPRLENAVPDVEAVAKTFSEKLGFEVRVFKNSSKADIIRALNELATEINSSDSVVVYYAGHGYSLEKNGAGYWIPSDAPVNDPSRWISNSDIAKLLAGIRSQQMALISDSCYSGAFARDGMAAVGQDVKAEDVLTKRSVVVLSSGGDEPVADEGKDGHSIFAWNLMKAMNSVENWRPGSTIFNEVQTEVRKEFPQTPKYGSVTSAGHQPGGDYLFELR